MAARFCCREEDEPDFSEDEQEWNAATNDLLLHAQRGDPPTLCPHCRHPLRYVKGAWMAGSAECARSGLPVRLSQPHFVCAECEAVVSMEKGPTVYFDKEYDLFDAAKHTTTVEEVSSGPHGQMHLRDRDIDLFASAGKSVAQDVVDHALKMGEAIAHEEEDVPDEKWGGANPLAEITAQQVQQLTAAARDVLASQPTVTEVGLPCTVFGDTHGQLRDVLMLFNVWGWPGKSPGQNFVFNGDFVDRGGHQVELAVLLLALKVQFPQQVWLNRGNHEDPEVNQRYGFTKACMSQFGGEGSQVFGAFHDAFAQLPLGCVIDGKILVVHGGLGNGNWTLDDLRARTRPISHEQIKADHVIFNVLWSDPVEDDDPTEEHTFGVHHSARSKEARKFGWDITEGFCKTNGLHMVVRSHQAKKHGFGFDVMHEQMLVRVFSARDYDHNQNDGAILSIRKEPSGLVVVRARVMRAISKE